MAGLAGEQQASIRQRPGQCDARIGIAWAHEGVGAADERIGVPASDQMLTAGEQPVHPPAEQSTELAEREVDRRGISGAGEVPGDRPADPALARSHVCRANTENP